MGFFPPLLFLLLVIQEFLLFFGGNPSFMLKIRGIFCFFFSSVSGLVLWFVAWMEANQALKALATHCQKWHSGSALKLLSKTPVPMQWLRGQEEQLFMFCAQFSPGFPCSKIRVNLEDIGHVLCVLNETLSNDLPMEIWQMLPSMGTKMAEVSAPKFSPD